MYIYMYVYLYMYVFIYIYILPAFRKGSATLLPTAIDPTPILPMYKVYVQSLNMCAYISIHM
jgi:hypothetical protein